MGLIGGPRHYHGPENRGAFKWKCPSCGTEQVTPMEAGCPSCGAGTAAQAEAAAVRASGPEIGYEALSTAVVGSPEANGLHLAMLTPAARRTVMAALAFYGEQGTPGTEELPRAVTLAWARKLYELDEETK